MVIIAMALAGMIAGGIWIGAVGALRHYRAVNETISSLLMAYIAIALMNHLVEGPLRDPASLNKPSTHPLEEAYRIGAIPGMDVHWGLVIGIVACVLSWVLIEKTRWGFAARIAGGNVRAAQVQGLAVGPLIVGFCALAGAFAGLAGMIEVSAVQGSANGSLAAGYGYAGILVAFLARHNPLAIIPVAVLLGGIDASGGLIQRRMDLPDATVLVLQGMLFIVILFSRNLLRPVQGLQSRSVEAELAPWRAPTSDCGACRWPFSAAPSGSRRPSSSSRSARPSPSVPVASISVSKASWCSAP